MTLTQKRRPYHADKIAVTFQPQYLVMIREIARMRQQSAASVIRYLVSSPKSLSHVYDEERILFESDRKDTP